MKEILITSSVLILALLVLRLVFAKKVRRALIYGAWALVALRLLIPVQIGQLDFSVLTAAQPVTEAITGVADKQVAGVTEQDAYREILQEYIEKDQDVFTPEVQEHIQSEIDRNVPKEEIAVMLDKVYPEKEVFRPEVQQQVQQQVEQTAAPITLGQIATLVWLVGVGAMAIWFAIVNLHHGRILRRNREKLDCDSPVPVFVSENAVSPCLAGLFRPVVYLTPGCAASEETKRHVLAHELTHLRHGDQIWSVVRCVCLCVYWFHPLVWVAAYFSRRDCELACDEGALKRLGEQERIAYGKSLLDVVAQAALPADLLHTATSMNETKKQLKERVNFIVKKSKVSLIAAICLVLICTIVAGCVASGPATNGQLNADPSDSTSASNGSNHPEVPTTDALIDPEGVTYTVTVQTVGRMPMEAVYVEIILGEKNAVGITDHNGQFSVPLSERGDYTVRISNVPEGYAVEESYSFTDKECRITLTPSLIQGNPAGVPFQVGDVMYDFSVSTPEGKHIQLSDLLAENDLVVLYFWYVDCTWSQGELPLLQEVYAEHGDNVEILALNPYPLDTDAEVVARRDQMELTFPVAKCGINFSPANFGSAGYPISVFIDRYGVICMIEEGTILDRFDREPYMRILEHFTAVDYQQKLIWNMADEFGDDWICGIPVL